MFLTILLIFLSIFYKYICILKKNIKKMRLKYKVYIKRAIRRKDLPYNRFLYDFNVSLTNIY